MTEVKRKTLLEYIGSGGTQRDFPAIFSQISGFENDFVDYYCDSYIGFLDEDMFTRKLNLRANIIIPAYVDKIAKITYIRANLLSGKTTADTGTVTFSNGAKKNKQTIYPANMGTGVSVNPSSIDESDLYTNSQTNNLLKTESITTDEKMRLLESLKKQEENIKITLLNEFKPLFFLVY